MFTHKTIHLIGIGGISMSAIAELLKNEDCTITGYDAQETEITRKLEKDGIKITHETNINNIENADIIIYTAAIKEDNEELSYARKNNKEVYERSEFLGKIMKEYENVICISGTHGKSTTTGMISTIFLNANLNPTINIGAILPKINGNYYIGSKKYFIAESCEYVDSFLDFFPTDEIILDIDNDHLDYFKNKDNIIKSFNKFTKLLPENGHLIINNDDNDVIKASNDTKNKITYGIKNNSNYMAKNITYDNYGHPNYDLYINNEYKINIQLNVCGIHNVYNSLAAICESNIYIKDFAIIKNSLEEYKGVGRRFEHIGNIDKNVKVYDDYAHHPTEILSAYNSAINTPHNKIWAIFQPHTYSRTYNLFNDFASVLSKFDNIIIAKTYAAREENIYNVKEEDLVNKIKELGNNNAIYIDNFEEIEKYLKNNIKENDLIITIGAGPVNKIAHDLLNK